ncbi:MAG: hypothetical protein AB7U31_07335 [Synergistaceae bacterium]
MKLAAGYAPEPAQQVGLHPDLFCSANDLPALGVSDFESPFAYGTGDGFFTPNEKYLIHRCRMFHNVILLSLILGTTLRNINLAGESSYCGVFYFTSIPVSRIGFILTGILTDYLRQNKRSKVLAPGQCQGAAWRQVGLAETVNYLGLIREYALQLVLKDSNFIMSTHTYNYLLVIMQKINI